MRTDMVLKTVVMAGGVGTRFWPLSRKRKPKQFLPIVSEKTMAEETVERLLPLVPATNIYTISNEEQARILRSLLSGIPEKNLLVEPVGKNTAPSLILATARIFLDEPEAVVAALPADHFITDSARFLEKLEAGAEAAAGADIIITFGIPPTYPATGYGYIHFNRENSLTIHDEVFYEVREFKEKPGPELARQFLAEGTYYWNSGMFLWRADVFAQKLEQYAPALFPFWERMLNALKDNRREELNAIFEEIPSISIDYALMEKAEGVLVCPGDFGWSDVGSWSSLFDLWQKDDSGSAYKGEVVCLNSRNCLVHSPEKLTALVGVENIIVVDAGDVLLVCHKAEDQRVKEILDALNKMGKKEYL